ncbi:MAG: amidohydrolase family protein [Ginsengibacter sp.]
MSQHIIDTHVHQWNLEKVEYEWLKGDTSILNKTYSIEELSPQLDKAHVTEGILVQAANNFADTDMMLETAAGTGWINGVVGWLPLMDPDATEKVLTEKYLNNTYFKGCRHLIHNETNAEWLLQDNVMESLKILAAYNIPYDIVGINNEHLKIAIAIAQKLPELKMVFDHLNQPPIAAKETFGLWGELMQAASQHKNLYAKISGLGTTAGNGKDWTKDDLKPYIMFVLEHFGTDHCFCGGDWPVALLAGPYEKAWLACQQILSEELSAEQQDQLLYQNAISFYNLSRLL